MRKVFKTAPADRPAEQIAPLLAGDLQRILSWENIWRISGSLASQGDAESYGLVFEVAKMKDTSGNESF